MNAANRQTQPMQPFHPGAKGPQKMTGIAPVFDMPYPLEGFKIFDAKSATKATPVSFEGPVAVRKGNILTSAIQANWLNKFLDNLVFQEFWFVMNKLSIFGLMMGLMFLGAVFFFVGFLTAFKTIPSGETTQQMWHAANTSGAASNELAHFGSLVAGSVAQDVGLKGASRVLGVAGRVQAKVPMPLQPFANYAANRVNQKVIAGAAETTDFAKESTRKILSHSMSGNPYAMAAQAQQAPIQQQPQPQYPQQFVQQGYIQPQPYIQQGYAQPQPQFVQPSPQPQPQYPQQYAPQGYAQPQPYVLQQGYTQQSYGSQGYSQPYQPAYR